VRDGEAALPSPAIRDDPRMAGCLLRFHTWPHIRAQTIGEHSWQVARVLLAIWPDAPRHLLVHCMTHDIGEGGPGDIPYPFKAENPTLKREMDRLEEETHLRMVLPWSLPAPVHLVPSEKAIFKLAEFIEMWEWGLQELMMGNQFARLVAQRCAEASEQRIADLPTVAIAEEAQRYMNRRRKEWRIE
jgi:5'-deoxynucleotidase YfbR-like HD superfamily hydrolase